MNQVGSQDIYVYAITIPKKTIGVQKHGISLFRFHPTRILMTTYFSILTTYLCSDAHSILHLARKIRLLSETPHFTSQLTKQYEISDTIDVTLRDAMVCFIKDTWNTYINHEVNRLVLGYEFYIDTASSIPVYYQLQKYENPKSWLSKHFL